MSGIHRNVYLYNVPEASVRDHVITSRLSDNYSKAHLEVKLDIDNRSKPQRHKGIRGESDGSQWPTDSRADHTLQPYRHYRSDSRLRPCRRSPLERRAANLYTVSVIQRDGKNGKEEMAFSTKHGFRDIRIDGSLLYINGKRVMLKGVNRHDSDPLYGRAVRTESMLRDVTLMKQNNINTIRTSHYPNNARMYAMFDHYGLYAIDEADLEDHANQSISDMPSWDSGVCRPHRPHGASRSQPPLGNNVEPRQRGRQRRELQVVL